MVVLFGALSIVAILIILPGWLFFRRRNAQSVWLLALPIFGIGFWLALAAAGLGSQSLANIVEVFGIATFAIVAAYIKFLAFDRSAALYSRGTFIAFAAVAVVTVGIRLFMPILPE
jgi:hypothetical protein